MFARIMLAAVLVAASVSAQACPHHCVCDTYTGRILWDGRQSQGQGQGQGQSQNVYGSPIQNQLVNTNNNQSSSSSASSATSSSSAQGGNAVATGGAVSNSGNATIAKGAVQNKVSTNVTVNPTLTAQGGAGGAGGSAQQSQSQSNNGNNTGTSSSSNSVSENYNQVRQVASAFATPPPTANPCLGSAGGAGQTGVLGLSFSGTHEDQYCVLEHQVALLHSMGQDVAACERARMGKEGALIDEAMKKAGIDCKAYAAPAPDAVTHQELRQVEDRIITKAVQK